MPPRLPLRPRADLLIGGESENLQVYLAPVDSPQMRERIGREKIVGEEGTECAGSAYVVTKTQGQRYRMAAGTTQGGRILLSLPGEGNPPVAALNWTRLARDTFISNIFVRRDLRSQGIGSTLVQLAQRDFPKLFVDGSLTVQGAKFFGYAEPAEELDPAIPAPRKSLRP